MDVARGCKALLSSTARPVLTCWMGGDAVRRAASLCMRAGIPTYSTPEEAVSAFLQVVHYRRNQKQLMEVPSSIPDFDCKPDVARAAYGVPVVETRAAADIDEARRAARDLGFPVAIKILSPDISHKSDVGGVALDIGTLEELNRAVDAMLARCRERRAGARLSGFTVQRMIKSDRACELITGVTLDPTFGLVAMFGQGGTAAEVVADRAVALLPLNMSLARELVSRTRVRRLLEGFRDRPPVDARSLALTLVRVSQLATDVGEIVELDINPLVADETGVVALDARIRVAPAKGRAANRLAIRPYPKELEEAIEVDGLKVLLRPVRPEDFAQHRAFLAQVTPEDRRTRFFHVVNELPERELARLTQIDYERETAFIAETAVAGVPQTLGVVRAHADPDNIAAELAILVRSDLKGRGLGSALLAKLIGYCRTRGIQRLSGEVLAENRPMLSLAAASGFQSENVGQGYVRVVLDLQRNTHTPAQRSNTKP
jgi:acetyltransferase